MKPHTPHPLGFLPILSLPPEKVENAKYIIYIYIIFSLGRIKRIGDIYT
jgi:hypothetical protein